MISERHVRLFKNGRNQAVRIPREFELPGEDAIMRKEVKGRSSSPPRQNPCWPCWPLWCRSTKSFPRP